MISKEDQKALDELHKEFEGMDLPDIDEVQVEPQENKSIRIEEMSGPGALESLLKKEGSTPEQARQDAQMLMLENLVEQLTTANSHLESMARVIAGP